jgi:hypothetical protein
VKLIKGRSAAAASVAIIEICFADITKETVALSDQQFIDCSPHRVNASLKD